MPFSGIEFEKYDIQFEQQMEQQRIFDADKRESILRAAVEDHSDTLHRNYIGEKENRRIKIRERLKFETLNSRQWNKTLTGLQYYLDFISYISPSINLQIHIDLKHLEAHKLENIVTLHARVIRICNEVCCLLRGGYADGALARCRTASEIVTIARTLKRSSELTNIRYQDWYKFRGSRIQGGSTQSTEQLVLKYGLKELTQENGWARLEFPDLKRKISISDLERLSDRTGNNIIREAANYEIHGGFVPRSHGLGASDLIEDFFLVGPSDTGIEIPARIAALEASQSIINLMELGSSIGLIVYQNLILKIMTELLKDISDEKEIYEAKKAELRRKYQK